MKWEEVRKLYPNQFVKFEVVDSCVKDNKEYVKEVAIIKAITDEKQARREFVDSKPGQYVYSTKNKEVIIELIKHIGVRRSV